MIIYNYKQLAREIARAQGIEPPPEPPMPLVARIALTIALTVIGIGVSIFLIVMINNCFF